SNDGIGCRNPHTYGAARYKATAPSPDHSRRHRALKSRRGWGRGGSVGERVPRGTRRRGDSIAGHGRLLLLTRHERPHLLLQHRQRHRTEVEDGVVEGALVEGPAEFALGFAA